MGSRNFFIKCNSKNLKTLRKEISKPIKISDNFIIIKIEDIKLNEKKLILIKF